MNLEKHQEKLKWHQQRKGFSFAKILTVWKLFTLN